MITTAAAILGSAVLSAGATALSASNASKAAKSAADAQSQSAADSIAEQRRQFDTIQANNEPYRQVGASSISALGGAFGLQGYGATAAPSMTGASYGSTPVANPGGVRMTGPNDRAIAVDAGSLGTGKLGNGVSIDPASAGPSMTSGTSGSPDYTAYIAAYPDIQSRVAELQQQGVIGPNGTFKTPEEFAAAQYANTGKTEGRTLPGVSMTQPNTSTGYTPAPGYTDPTAPNGYTVGARPTAPPVPGQYQAPALDVGLDKYQQSPDYNFRLSEGNKALSNVASSMGGIMSGARLKAADRYNQNFATTDYTNWRDYTTGQYNVNNAFGNQVQQETVAQANADRARSDGLYQDDRSYDAGRMDARTGQLMTLAGFGQSANNANANAAQSFATNSANLSMTAANAQGNAAINGANAFTNGVNNLVTTGAYLGGKYMTGGFGGGTTYDNYNPTYMGGDPTGYVPY